MFSPPPFHPNRRGTVAPVRIDPTGEAGPTRAQARSTVWRRTTRGFYVPVGSAHATDTQQRIVEAATVLPAGGAVTGWAGLHWLGGHWFDGLAEGGRTRRDVPLVVDRHVRTQAGIAVSQEFLRNEDWALVDGLAVTSPVRSSCFEMRHAPSDRQAVVALDMTAYSDLVSISDVTAYAVTLGPWTGIGRCRTATELGDENAWSPREVTMRLTWELDAGRPRPLCNVPVFGRDGRHIGTPDLLDPVAGVVGEYDGALHLVGSQRARDVRRETAFRSAGLECVTMLAADGPDPAGFVERLEATYRRARFEAESRRAWTITPPSWWIPTTTVAQRLALDPDTRARLLRHRRAA